MKLAAYLQLEVVFCYLSEKYLAGGSQLTTIILNMI